MTAAVFSGVGLNDLTASGVYTYASAPGGAYVITIDGTGTPDTFSWQLGAGPVTSGVAITGAAQSIGDPYAGGFKVKFGATFGHTLGDSWTSATPAAWNIVSGHPTSHDGDQIQAATGLSGQVLITVTVLAIGTSSGFGPDIEIFDSINLYFEAHAPGTYSFLGDAGDVFLYSDGDNNVVGSVSVKSYAVPYTTPVPSFATFTDGANPTPLEFRYSAGSVGIGYQSASNSTGSDVVAVGEGAASSNTGSNVVATGDYAAYNNTGSYVIAVGNIAASNNTGSDVVAVGRYAAYNNTGSDVVAVGEGAASSNTGSYVIAVGDSPAYNNTGSDVVAVGNGAASSNTGSDVVAVGRYAAYNNTGSDVVAIGREAAFSKTAGDNATFLGSGETLTGTQKAIDNSIVIGSSTSLGGKTAVNNSGATQLTNIIAIGGVATDSNQTVIGNSSTTQVTIFGSPAGLSGVQAACWNGTSLGYGTIAEITGGTCH